MNSEKMITMASEALDFFQTRHVGTAHLYFKDGHVVCWDLAHRPHKIPNELIVSVYQQKVGLTGAQWDAIGTTLINLYNREVACQARQKP